LYLTHLCLKKKKIYLCDNYKKYIGKIIMQNTLKMYDLQIKIKQDN